MNFVSENAPLVNVFQTISKSHGLRRKSCYKIECLTKYWILNARRKDIGHEINDWNKFNLEMRFN